MGDLLRVNEIFGPTLQGEGPRAGWPAHFLRLTGCNLDCVWCDTPYTWDWQGKNGWSYDREAETHHMTQRQVIDRLGEDVPLLIISGGEPLIQQRALEPLCDNFAVVDVETNGTVAPRDTLDVNLFVVSPKLASSGCGPRRDNPAAIAALRERDAVWKFVICSPEDVHEVELWVALNKVPRPDVWLMPEGRTKEEVTEKMTWLFPLAADHGYRLTSRLHVLAYGAERGV